MTITEREKLEKITGRIHHTESFGAVDGPGVRFVFFTQGCPMRCLYCHNPDAIPASGGELWTAKQAAAEVMRYKHYIKSGGVTFSGGEPLMQPKFITAVSKLLAENGISAAIDTSGCISLDNGDVKNAIDAAGIILLDIKAADNETAKKLTGHDLKNAYALLDYCEKTGKSVWIRHVLVAGYTLDYNILKELATKLKGYKCIRLIELLPFHKLGEHKWTDTNFKYQLSDTPATDQKSLERAKDIFAAEGFKVQ